ncbi:hypothetical protein QJS10_CPB17g00871 [Acorus calamus]|uniref:Essential protein Yae1 N-terminal domain-containing protein n=1 Tax=Acorus calamus TaxID=4465 RepID=A0AAV9CTB2_ACOCL|nr:hypothetical protein QJS10_CPB17g00871 [Acorus calamus]
MEKQQQNILSDPLPRPVDGDLNKHFDDGDDDIWYEDESQNNELENGLGDGSSEVEREWERRHNKFHTMGYRDGLIAGKEASAQEGFNTGFKQSVLVGYKWGVVRGITSVLVSLPDRVRENLVGPLEKRERLQNLHHSVQSISSNDALSIFHDSMLKKRSELPNDHTKGETLLEDVEDEDLGSTQLGSFVEELDLLLQGSPVIKVHFQPVV